MALCLAAVACWASPAGHLCLTPLLSACRWRSFTDAGDACFGGSPPSGLSMATDRNGKSWVAFVESDPAFVGRVTVMSLEAGVWTVVGARGFSDFAGINETAARPTLAFSKANVSRSALWALPGGNPGHTACLRGCHPGALQTRRVAPAAPAPP